MSNLMMPKEFYGPEMKSNGHTNTMPRRWTKDEINWVLSCHKNGHSVSEISQAIGRSEISVAIKLKRESKASDTYNDKNREIKYEANRQFLNRISAESVLDLYSGNSFYLDKDLCVVTNDIDEKFLTDFSEDAFDLISKMSLARDEFDLVDLDPYGSAYECIEPAVKVSQKGLIVSFGEWGHKRFKRFDFVQPRYGINSINDFTENNFAEEVKRIAKYCGKIAKPTRMLKYGNFLRIYFLISEK